MSRLYEAFAIIAVFLLYVHLVREDGASPFDVIEHNMLEADAKKTNGRIKMGWLKVRLNQVVLDSFITDKS